MTQRKPPGDALDSWIETQIRAAMDDGAFANLPGAGKPLPNAGQAFDPLWWQKQLVQRERINALPPALELRRKVAAALAALATLPDEAAVRQQAAALNAEIARVNATVMDGPPTSLGLLNPDDLVAQWRRVARPTDPA